MPGILTESGTVFGLLSRYERYGLPADIDGTTLQTYEHPDATATRFGLDAVHDEGSFWVSDTTNNRVVQSDIGTGVVLAETVIPTGATPWGVLVHDPPSA